MVVVAILVVVIVDAATVGSTTVIVVAIVLCLKVGVLDHRRSRHLFPVFWLSPRVGCCEVESVAKRCLEF